MFCVSIARSRGAGRLIAITSEEGNISLDVVITRSLGKLVVGVAKPSWCSWLDNTAIHRLSEAEIDLTFAENPARREFEPLLASIEFHVTFVREHVKRTVEV